MADTATSPEYGIYAIGDLMRETCLSRERVVYLLETRGIQHVSPPGAPQRACFPNRRWMPCEMRRSTAENPVRRKLQMRSLQMADRWVWRNGKWVSEPQPKPMSQMTAAEKLASDEQSERDRLAWLESCGIDVNRPPPDPHTSRSPGVHECQGGSFTGDAPMLNDYAPPEPPACPPGAEDWRPG
ncbi:MAG TPA: hypothetical protein VHQ47_07500 [Phycisphaerae bacterium]|nr:hypothetical protein [Phycisphaerae bacterium]